MSNVFQRYLEEATSERKFGPRARGGGMGGLTGEYGYNSDFLENLGVYPPLANSSEKRLKQLRDIMEAHKAAALYHKVEAAKYPKTHPLSVIHKAFYNTHKGEHKTAKDTYNEELREG